MAGNSRYYEKPVQPKDGDTAYARDVNDISDRVDAGFVIIEGEIDQLQSDVTTFVAQAKAWAVGPNEPPERDTEVEPGKFCAEYYAYQASLSEIAAGDSETAAADSETKALQWAEEPEDSPVETSPTKYSALHWAAKAAASATAADASADLAAQWAQEAEDVEISPGFFSAFHWSQKALDSSNLAAVARDKAEQWAEEPENSPVETTPTVKYSALHWAAKAEDIVANTSHNDLTGRSLADAHPRSAITGAEIGDGVLNANYSGSNVANDDSIPTGFSKVYLDMGLPEGKVLGWGTLFTTKDGWNTMQIFYSHQFQQTWMRFTTPPGTGWTPWILQYNTNYASTGGVGDTLALRNSLGDCGFETIFSGRNVENIAVPEDFPRGVAFVENTGAGGSGAIRFFFRNPVRNWLESGSSSDSINKVVACARLAVTNSTTWTLTNYFNVSSVTRISAGRYRFNFQNGIYDANFAQLVSTPNSDRHIVAAYARNAAFVDIQFRVLSGGSDGVPDVTDSGTCYMAVIRKNSPLTYTL